MSVPSASLGSVPTAPGERRRGDGAPARGRRRPRQRSLPPHLVRIHGHAPAAIGGRAGRTGAWRRPAPAHACGRNRRVTLRSPLWMLVRIVAVPELAVLDLGEGALGYVNRASGRWARVVGDQVVEGGAVASGRRSRTSTR